MNRSALHRVRPQIAVLLLGAIVAVTACGDDGDALPETVEIVASDYAFDDLPARIGPETTLTMRNTSTREVHELVAFPLPDDLRGTAAEILALPEEQLASFLDGPPALVIIAGPGGDSVVPVGDGTLPTPGRYILFCAIPTGADPAEFLAAAEISDGPPDVPGGPPHFVHGMAATVEVVSG